MAAATTSFLDLHTPGTPLLMPNPWDAGSARLLASLGFRALATTSSGHAATLGRLDGSVTRDESIAHAAAVVAAVPRVPVSADFENGFGDAPDDVAQTARLALGAGLAGFSIEDSTQRRHDPIYDPGLATERVAAAAEIAHADGLVLTGRCEMYLHGQRDLAAVIGRLQAYSAAGADVLFAPGVVDLAEVRELVSSVDKPVSVLARPECGSVPELGEVGVARISVGGAFAFAALGAVVDAARELLDRGTFGYWTASAAGAKAARAAFADRPAKP